LKITELHADKATDKLPFSKRAKAVVQEGRLIYALKVRLKPIVVAAGKSALRKPWIKRSVLALLNTSPELKNRLYRLVWKDIALAPRAMRIYTALSTSIPTHSKGSE
jgi:anti-sigma factor RsiW